MSYKYRSVERRHRDGYYSCKLKQLNDLWQQFCDLNKEVQQAAIPTESEYSSRLVALRELVEKYQKIFLDNIPTGSGLPKAPRRTSANFKITTGDQVKGDSAIDRELESSLTLASNAPTVTPAIQRHLDLHWALLRQAHDELDSTPGRSSGRSRASPTPHIIRGIRNEPASIKTSRLWA